MLFVVSFEKETETTPGTMGLHCPLSLGNHAPTQKFERPNRKIPKSIFFLSQELHGRKGCYCLSLMKGCVIFSALLLWLVEMMQPCMRLSQ